MEQKFTPGPWEAHIWDILDNRTLEPTGKKRMDIQYRIFPDIKVGRTLATLDFENEANVYLIAAAPDLLEACESALEALRGAVTQHGQACALKEGGDCDCWLPLRRRAIDQLKAATAKAAGLRLVGGQPK